MVIKRGMTAADLTDHGYSLPRQHSLVHYTFMIHEFGEPSGLISSITIPILPKKDLFVANGRVDLIKNWNFEILPLHTDSSTSRVEILKSHEGKNHLQ